MTFKCLLLSPCAFLAADYIVLGRLADAIAPNHLLIRRSRLVKLFVGSDITTFLLQGAGGLFTKSLPKVVTTYLPRGYRRTLCHEEQSFRFERGNKGSLDFIACCTFCSQCRQISLVALILQLLSFATFMVVLFTWGFRVFVSSSSSTYRISLMVGRRRRKQLPEVWSQSTVGGRNWKVLYFALSATSFGIIVRHFDLFLSGS
jgi:hypothetical protein